MKSRRHGVHMTSEARILREMRLNRRFSMRHAGELVGKSDSYISQIENGRMKPPVGEALNRLLEIYHGPSEEIFYARVRSYREKITEKDEIIELLAKTNPSETTVILKIMKALVA